MSIWHFSEKTHIYVVNLRLSPSCGDELENILGEFLVAALVRIHFSKFVGPVFSNIWYLPLTDHPVYISTVNI